MNLNEQSDRDFSRARRRAFLRRVGAYLRGEPGSDQLLSFDAARDGGAVRPTEQAARGSRGARRRAFPPRVGAYLRGDPGSNQLLSFDDVKDALGVIQQVHIGLREVPGSKLVGSGGGPA